MVIMLPWIHIVYDKIKLKHSSFKASYIIKKHPQKPNLSYRERGRERVCEKEKERDRQREREGEIERDRLRE